MLFFFFVVVCSRLLPTCYQNVLSRPPQDTQRLFSIYQPSSSSSSFSQVVAGADQMKIGFVSRKARTDRHNHVILATQFYKPVELATNITMSVTNMWGIIKMLSDKFLAMDDGKVRRLTLLLLVVVVVVVLMTGFLLFAVASSSASALAVAPRFLLGLSHASHCFFLLPTLLLLFLCPLSFLIVCIGFCHNR